jgi:hypothetical protein
MIDGGPWMNAISNQSKALKAELPSEIPGAFECNGWKRIPEATPQQHGNKKGKIIYYGDGKRKEKHNFQKLAVSDDGNFSKILVCC